MNLGKGRRKRRDRLDDNSLEMKTKITKSDTKNGVRDINKKITICSKTSKPIDSNSPQVKLTKYSSTSTIDKYACFSCKLKDDYLIKCSLNSCDKLYHKKCLEKLPSSKTEVQLCPLHICLTCFNTNPKNPQISKGDMLKCSECPTAVHNKEICFIPGAVISSNNEMLCPQHFSPEQQRKYSGIMKLVFCVQCGCNEDLMFCKFCPTAIHNQCCKTKAFSSDNYICDRCVSRKTVSFNEIVWVKVYNFRWWPAIVVNPNNIPDGVHEIKHFEGEFPVKFFGTDQYFWIQMGRVYPFVFKQIGIEDKYLKHNFKKVIPDSDFDDAVQLALKAIADKKFMSVEPTNHKKPPPYKHIKSNRPIGSVQIYTLHDVSDYNSCGCKAEDPQPCGYDSMCLNRNMCTECHEDVCEVGELCQNQKFQKREYASAKPFWTDARGWGLKSLEDIKKGNFVIEYCGDLIDEEECERRIQQKQLIGDTNFYFCTLDSTRIIDAGPKGNLSRFMNHSCEPNCETQKWIVEGDARVGIFAKHDIPSGSELTFDYQMDFSHFEKLKCNCGSKKCSGLIGKKPHHGVFHSPAAEESDMTAKAEIKTVNGTEKKMIPKKGVIKVKNVKKSDISPNLQSGNVKEDGDIKRQNGMKKDGDFKTQNGGKNDCDFKRQNGVKKDKLLCFKCKTGGKQVQCSRKKCGKSFHLRCLRPGLGAKDTVPPNWECLCHFCKKCKGRSTYQCYMCPNSYCDQHVSNKSKIGRFACPKHDC